MKPITPPLLFKEALEVKQDWLTYFIILLTLVILALVFVKKQKTKLEQSDFQIVDKKRLGTKTFVYLLKYQNQQFLLAENQQALTFQKMGSEFN